MADIKYIVLDFETGGLSPDKNPAVEVALLVADHEFNAVEKYSAFIQPYGNLTINPKALQVNGISMEEIEGGKLLKTVVTELSDIFKKYKAGRYGKPIMVCHNYPFDFGFLDDMFSRVNLDPKKFIDEHGLCTIRLAKLIWRGQETKFNLLACCDKAGIELVDAHRAAGDVDATFKLLQHLAGGSSGSSSGAIVDKIGRAHV